MTANRRIALRVFSYGVLMVIVACLGAGMIRGFYTVPVLMYHHVARNTGGAVDTVSPETFRWQMSFLKENNYRVIGLEEFVDRTIRGTGFPPRTVVLTFDDGYADNFEYALPVLQELRFPATVFVSPEWIGEEGFLSWGQIRKMHQAGIQFGSHGMTQAYLPEISAAQRRYEIFESRRILSQHLKGVNFFCYPVGGFNEDIKKMLQAAGYRGATATNRGTDRLNKDLYEINRIRMSDRERSSAVMVAKLSGYYNLFRRLKNSE